MKKYPSESLSTFVSRFGHTMVFPHWSHGTKQDWVHCHWYGSGTSQWQQSHKHPFHRLKLSGLAQNWNCGFWVPYVLPHSKCKNCGCGHVKKVHLLIMSSGLEKRHATSQRDNGTTGSRDNEDTGQQDNATRRPNPRWAYKRRAPTESHVEPSTQALDDNIAGQKAGGRRGQNDTKKILG